VTLPAIVAVLAGAAPANAYDEADLSASLTRQMARATAASGLYVEDLDSGRRLFAQRADSARLPASVEKLYTTATTLLRLGPNTTLATSAVSSAALDSGGVLHGNLVLVGDGDPFFGNAAAARLARAVRAAGVKRIDGAVVGDESEFDSLRSGCCTGYDPDLGGVLSALAYDRGIFGGRAQVRAAPYAAARFAALLDAAGVRSAGKPRAGSAPIGAGTLAAEPSPDVRDLIRLTNVPSNNFAAEMLLKTLGARYGARGSTLGGAAVVRTTLDDIGVRPHVVDGSGLSRKDHTTPHDVVRLLARMDEPDVDGVFRASLAVAGVTGTVKARMRGTAAYRRCRVKTGTLHDVSGLAGYCRTVSGRDIAFAVLMNHVSDFNGAHAIQDRIAAAIAQLGGAPAVTAPTTTSPTAPTTTTPATATSSPTGGAGPQ
jgi:D-alanyl-D-alanine carboxypeptidase/D-alanyl-D-alanine-endopeptidase (penicillin-binding protein 4)